MYRTFKTLPWVAAASALALTMACNSAPDAPTSPGTSTGGQDAAADGSTLKAGPPALVSPVNDFRLSTRAPTLVINNSSGVYVNRPFSYEFHLLDDAGNVVRSTTLDGGDGTTSWVYPEDLDRDTPYRWRARARVSNSIGPWSPTGRFFTVKENRTPNPTSGRLPLPGYGESVVRQVAGQRPDLLARSCQEHGGTWEFLDLVVDTLRLQDTRWGYNGKRGNPNDPSLDVVTYNYGSEPDENTINVYIVDTITGHCGPAPGPAWGDVTEVTRQGGSIGRWISRGRFPGSQGVQ